MLSIGREPTACRQCRPRAARRSLVGKMTPSSGSRDAGHPIRDGRVGGGPLPACCAWARGTWRFKHWQPMPLSCCSRKPGRKASQDWRAPTMKSFESSRSMSKVSTSGSPSSWIQQEHVIELSQGLDQFGAPGPDRGCSTPYRPSPRASIPASATCFLTPTLPDHRGRHRMWCIDAHGRGS